LTANPVSFYLVELAYPKDLTLAAPGVTLARTASSERTHVLIAFGPARDLFIALGTELKLFFEHRDGILLRSFAPNAQSTASPSILDTAARALSVYEKAYGPYPYHELTFVGARFEAEGLEFPGMILLTSWLYQNARTSVDGSTVGVARELTVAHETAHQWFYALVGNNQITEPWIDESMAQYSTWLYWKNRYGGERAARLERSFQWEAAHDGGLPLGLPVGAYTPREYDLTIYGRGPLFILDLAHALGQGRFESYIRGIVEKYRFKVITGKELELSAESACGCSLAQLWSTWINGRSSRPR
jgi:aminopeptidase N